MKLLMLIFLVWSWCLPLLGQTYKSTDSKVTFFSDAPLEDIKATNKDATGLFDSKSGELAFVVPIKGFEFRKSLMQQHFNERFMESDKYPRGTFQGQLSNYDMESSGTQKAVAKGKMTIHGITRDFQVTGDFTVSGNKIEMEAVFPIKVADYDVEIPKVLFYNISEEVEVTVNFKFNAQ
ncbi:YceI family protein [Echinicola jeungdonensis]|uniref:YceI family protein n=1 Tax=Echinicola jeungdonensis TaxID=709343 RepID=A0ABV5J2V3_9BACT|nr:YceI family protein [Echinicola jeungdonensis]MDN3667779.1 YceI family protein [Echinicola jeungdonensis]